MVDSENERPPRDLFFLSRACDGTWTSHPHGVEAIRERGAAIRATVYAVAPHGDESLAIVH